MPAWGPVTVNAGPGAATPDGQLRTLFDTGTVPVGSVHRIGGTSHVTFVGGHNDAAYDIRATSFASNGDIIELVQLVQQRLVSPDSNWSYTVPLGATRVLVQWLMVLYQGQTASNTSSGTFDNAGFCQFGTRLNGTAAAAVTLTESVLSAALLARGVGWLYPALTPLIGITIDTLALCGSGPPQMPALGPDIFTWSPQKLLQLFEAITWSNFCECIPGTPTPFPYPPPQPVQPPNFPSAPTFPCDPADLCSSISQIRASLNSLQGTVANVYGLVTLLQRYELPFAYIPGAAHSGLTLKGSFAVTRLIGLKIEIVAKPAGSIQLRGNPPYQFDMGWLAVVDANGFLEEKRLTRDTQLWFPRDMQTAIGFQWDLFDQVVIRVTELQAEP